METQKPNDMLVAVLQRPQANLNDLYISNINLENTQLLKPDEYKMLPKVQEKFKTTSGAFDDAKFTEFYNKAASLYQDLSMKKSAANALEYDPMDYTAPANAKNIDVRPIARVDLNPLKSYYSRTGVNSVDTNELSLRELAQQSKIFDTERGKWLDDTANDRGFFGTTFGKTLVYAQWDTDGENINPLTNKLEKHKKGDWKINEEGSYYVETLGNREIYGKQIVNPKDLITREGSALNKIDFFDSDGKDKSVFGTTMKLASEIAPFLIPGFNIGGAAIKVAEWYGALKMGIGLASVLPTFYKAAEGIILGDNKDGIETDLWKGMNATEGFMKKFTDRSLSDSSSGSMWNYEQLGSMVSDVFSQIYEQRAIAGMSKILYKMDDEADLKRLENLVNEAGQKAINKGLITSKEQAKKIAEQAFKKGYEHSALGEKRSQLAKSLSLGYMAMTQSGDVYGEALAGGYDRRTAGFTAMMAAAGQYGLMANNRMGDWFLDRTTGYTEGQSRAVVKKLTKSLMSDTQEAFNKFEVNAPEGRKALANVFTKFKDGFASIIKDPIEQSEIVENLWKRAVIEGVEEVTEQAAIDAAKGITDTMSYLGMTNKQGSFGGFNTVFSKEGFQNYLANFIGGMLGGPMFELERSVISPALNGSFEAPTTKADLYDLVSTGRTQDVIDEIQRSKSKYGSEELSPIATKLPNGESVFLPTESMSQADMIANALIQRVKNLEKIINSESLGNTDEDIIRKSIIDQIYIDDLTKSGVDKFVLSDVKELGEQIVDLREKLDAFKDTPDDKNIKDLTDQLNAKRQELTDILTGTKEEEYHGLALFALNNKYHRPFLNMTIDEYVKEKYDKDYYSLGDSEKETYLKKFEKDKDLTEGNLKNKMKFMYTAFKAMNETFGQSIINYDKDGYASVRSGFFEILHKVSNGSIDYKSALKRLNEVNAVLKGGTHTDAMDITFPGVNLSTDTNISLGKFLIDNGIISKKYDLTKLPEIQQKYRDFFEKTVGKFDNEQDFQTATQAAITRNEIGKKLKSLYENYETLSKKEVLDALYEPIEVGETKIDFTSLSENEKNIVKEAIGVPAIGNVISQHDNIKAALDKISAGVEISPEEMTALGFTPSKDTSTYATQLTDALKRTSGEFDNWNREKIGELTNPEIDKFQKEYETAAVDTEGFSENEKNAVINFLDNLGLETSMFDENTLEKIINDSTAETNKNLKEIMAQSGSAELDSLINEGATAINNIKVNKIGRLEINARRGLLLTYIEQMKEKNELVDSRAMEELQREKELLDNLINHHKDIESFFASSEEDWEPYYQKELDRVDDALKYAETHNKENDLYNMLKKFEIEIFGWNGPISFFEVLQDNLNAFANNVSVKSDFIRSDIQLEQIKKAEYTIQAIKAVVESMNSTEWGESNLYGMNVMLNKALEKEGKAAKYQLLNSQASYTIMKDLELIEAKLSYFKDLALSNSVSPIETDLKIKDIFTENIVKQYLDADFNLSLVNLKLGGKPIFSGDDLSEILKIEDNEVKMIELEDLFYRKFHAASGTLNEKLADLSQQLVPSKGFAESIKISTEMNLNTDFKTMDSLTWFKWIHTILASNSKKFYEEYKNNVEKELSLHEEKKDKKAPLFSQMIVIRSADAYIKNKQIIANIANTLQDNVEVSNNIDEIVEAISSPTSKFRIQNIQTILGSGGTGKSSVVANFITNTLVANPKVGPKLKVTAIAPSKSTLDIITKDLTAGIDLSIQKRTVAELINSLLNIDGQSILQKAIDWLENHQLNNDTYPEFNKIEGLSDYFLAGSGDGAVLIRQKFFDDFLQPTTKDEIHLIIGDEMSKYTTLEWQILNAASGRDNVYTILMGDELQSGIHIGDNSFSMDNIFVNSSIKMKNTIRAKNTLKSDNSVVLEAYTQKVKQKYLYDSGETLLPVDLFYSEDKFLSGDKLVSAITTTDLKKLDPNKEIVVITENGRISPELDTKLKEVFGDKPIEVLNKEVQGREFDQVIIDLNIKSNNPYEETREFYTLLSRAKEVTLAKLDTNVQYNLAQRATSKNSFISKDMITNALTNRLNYLKNLDLTSNSQETISESAEEKPVETNLTEDKIHTPKAEESIEDTNKGQELPETPKKDEVIEDNTTKDDSENLPDQSTLGKDQISEKDFKQELGFTEPAPVNTIDLHTEADDEASPKKESEEPEKDMDKMLSYSFFNNLGISTDDPSGPSILDDYLDVVISSNPIEGQMTWEQIRRDLGNALTGTDLFAIENFEGFEGRTVKDIIHEYIKFKNTILFTKQNTSLFGINTENTKWVLKKIYDSKDSKKILSYKKLVNHNIPTNSIYAIGVYVDTGNGKPIYITLSVTPDLQNGNVNNKNVNTELLKSIYDKVDTSENNEVLIDQSKISIYKRPYIPKHKDSSENKKKYQISEVELTDFNKVFPGASIEVVNNNIIRVFWGVNDRIAEEYEALTGIKLTDAKQIESLRFRPYIVVNYAEGLNNTRRLVLLNTKKRSAIEFWNAFKNEYEESGKHTNKEEGQLVKTGSLISKYRAWEMMFNFIKYLKSNNPEQLDNFINDLEINFQWMTENNGIKWGSLPGVINSMRNFNMNGNNPFEEWINQDSVYQDIVKDAPAVTKTNEYKISNVLYYAYKPLTEGYANLFNSFLMEYDKPIYSNPLIQSVKAEGAAFGTLKEGSENYNINVAIEPNKVIVDMNNLIIEPKTEVTSKIEETKPTEEPKKQRKYNKSFEIGNLTRFSDDSDPIKSTNTYNWDLKDISLKHSLNPDGKLDADILSEMDKVFTNFMQMQTKEDDEYVFETVGDDGIPKVVFDDDGEQIDLQTYVKNKIYNINSYILNVQDGKLKALTPVVSSLQLDIINPNTEIKCNIK